MPRLMWLDLETTGLDPHKEQILEVALRVADLRAPFDAVPALQTVVHFPRERWDELIPVVREMHTKNGLLEDCARYPEQTIDLVEEQLLRSATFDAVSKDDRPILAGSSVHLDYSFLEVHMPRLFKKLAYRLYDVSGLKLFCQSMGMPQIAKAEAHRADADIRESISHGRECERWIRNNLGPGPDYLY